MLVEIVEAALDLGLPGVVERAVRDRNVDGVLLARVAHVGSAGEDGLELSMPSAEKAARIRSSSSRQTAVRSARLGDIGAREPRLNEVVAEVAQEHAPGREVARRRRDDYPRNLQLAGKRHRVHRSAAPEGDDCELTRVAPAAETDTSLSRLIMLAFASRITPSAASSTVTSSASAMGARAARAVRCRRDPATEEVVGVDPAGNDVRVGHRRLGAAPAVGNRARVGACALRPHLECAGRVEPRDRPPPADLDDVDDRHLHGVAGEGRSALDVVVARQADRAALDEEAFAVVPPMSSVIRFSSPSRSPIAAAPITPPAGPDSIRLIGVRPARSNRETPPFDRIA